MKDYLIDTHAHLDMLADFDITGVGKVVVPSVEIKNMEKVISLSEIPNVYSMIGLYPSEAKTYSKEIEEWVGINNDTALCPYCGIDSIICESSEYPMTEDFLKEMRKANI